MAKLFFVFIFKWATTKTTILQLMICFITDIIANEILNIIFDKWTKQCWIHDIFVVQ